MTNKNHYFSFLNFLITDVFIMIINKTTRVIQLKFKFMKDKICIITGANSGIGKATAKELALNGATVVMICRNKEKGNVGASGD